MNPAAKLLWGSFLGVVIVIIVCWIVGCGGSVPAPKRVQALSCLDLANAALENAQTCEEARAALAKAIKDAPACMQLFGVQIRVENDAGAMASCEEL